MKSYNFFFIIIICIISGCKKDRLTDEKEIFIGKWIWSHSEATLNVCSGSPQYNVTLTPVTESANYYILFERKGKVSFYQNDVSVDKHRIVFSEFGEPYTCSEPGYTFYAIDLDNESGTDVTKGLQGCIKSDTLIVGLGFPYYDDGCNFYHNYFVKE